MRSFSLGTVVVLGAAIAIDLYGCSRPAASPPTATADPSVSHDHSDHDHRADDGDSMAKMKEELAKLSDPDRESAMKQHYCPVSDEMLGTMGAPIKLTVNEQEVWICCDGCREKLTDDPEKYLAKIGEPDHAEHGH